MSRRRRAPGVPSGPFRLSPREGAKLVRLVRANQRAVHELVQRFEVPWLDVVERGVAIGCPADLAGYLGPEMAGLAQEQMRVVCLDTKRHVLGTQLVYQGGINATSVRLADLFREAVRLGADSVILVHNHPSTDPAPSPEDVRLTEQVARMGLELGIEVLDHLVIGGDRHASLRGLGLYTPPAPPRP